MYRNLSEYLPEITYEFYKTQIKKPYEMFYIEFLQAIEAKINSEFESCLYNVLYKEAEECCSKIFMQLDGKLLGIFDVKFGPKIKELNIKKFRDAIVEDLISGKEDVRSDKDYIIQLEVPYTHEDFMKCTLMYFNSSFKDMGFDFKERMEDKITKHLYGESSDIPKEEQVFKLYYTMTKFLLDRMEDFLYREAVNEVYGYIYESGICGEHRWLLDAVIERVRNDYYNIYYNKTCNKYARNYNNPNDLTFAMYPSKYVGTGHKSPEFSPVATRTLPLNMKHIADEEADKRGLKIPNTSIFTRDMGHTGKVVYALGRIIIRENLYTYFLPQKIQLQELFNIHDDEIDMYYNDFINRVFEWEFRFQIPHYYAKIKVLLIEGKFPIDEYSNLYGTVDPNIISDFQPLLHPAANHEDMMGYVGYYEENYVKDAERNNNNKSNNDKSFERWISQQKRKATEELDRFSWGRKVPIPREFRKKLEWYVTLYEWPSKVWSEGRDIMGPWPPYSRYFDDMLEEYIGLIPEEEMRERNELKELLKDSMQTIFKTNPNISEFKYYAFIDVMINYYYRDMLEANLENPKYSLSGRLIVAIPFTTETLREDIIKVRREIAKYEPKSIEECITISAFRYSGFIE